MGLLNKWSQVAVWLCLWQVASGTRVRLSRDYIYPNNQSNAGSVEVLYNGTWGAICSDYWDINDARVFCRQLNFSDALSAPCCSAFGFNMTKPFWLDDVRCHGNETDISECGHRGWGVHDCSRFHASVVCKPKDFTNGFEFRLAGSMVPYAGRVEVLYGGVWGDIDNYGWDLNAGHVACRSLGYPLGALVIVTQSLGIFLGATPVKWMDDIRCQGNESSLVDCQYELEMRMTSGSINGGVVCNTGNNTGDPSVQRLILLAKISVFFNRGVRACLGALPDPVVPCLTHNPLPAFSKKEIYAWYLETRVGPCTSTKSLAVLEAPYVASTLSLTFEQFSPLSLGYLLNLVVLPP